VYNFNLKIFIMKTKIYKSSILLSVIALLSLGSYDVSAESPKTSCPYEPAPAAQGDAAYYNMKNKWFGRGCKPKCGHLCYIKGGHPELPSISFK
jgi:hypothetical protein